TARLARAAFNANSFGTPVNVDTVTTAFMVSTTPQLTVGGGHVYLVWTSANQNTSIVDYRDLTGDDVARTIPTDPFVEDVAVGEGGGRGQRGGGGGVRGGGGPPGVFFAGGAGGVFPPPPPPAAPAVRLTRTGVQRQLDGLSVASDGTVVAFPDRLIDNDNQT